MSLLGSLFGSSDKAKVSTPEPWKPMQPYLKQGMAAASNAFNNAGGAYKGSLYAGLNQTQTDAARGLARYANSNGLTALTSQLAQQSGANAQNIFNRASMDPTQTILGQAAQFANSPYADGMIDAASRDVNRNLNENQITGLNLAAGTSGNMNSSRTGAMEGIMRRGAADRVADISAGIRGDLYNTGLGMAQSQWNQNLGNMVGANAAMGGAIDNAANAQGVGFGNYDAAARAGSIFQNNAQANLDQRFQKWQMNDQRPWDNINRYMGVITGTPQGSAGTPYTQPGTTGIIPGVVGTGIAAAGAGLFGDMSNGGLFGLF